MHTQILNILSNILNLNDQAPNTSNTSSNSNSNQENKQQIENGVDSSTNDNTDLFRSVTKVLEHVSIFKLFDYKANSED